ncbi:hypothetical protein P255_01953 [Acinetobacter brisouii CIP 110357]|uniref:Polysaccharide biosynthesis protein C-terminal domain-containing protein n=1 Tax=Acinetobacter brisouii CIP 110357 TaxID=1341683 RepID=V2UAI6_9GAMM|nr:oligosaccharide flippase family protein [Acinetobacter brisouii]ENV47588.1 hypothetical protein F954_00642 [Acinetobacter brisouii ANC 4119]ESK51438.1 hypothetical protein P255_01953 [Acinetobacter brisouii CIP 110357]
MKNYVWVFVEKFSVILVKFITTAIMARFILPKDFGSFAIINYIIITATVVIDSGLGGSIIRKKNIKNIDYSTINVFQIISSIVVISILFVLGALISNYYNDLSLIIILKLMLICLFFRSLSVIYIAYMIKNMQFKKQAAIYLFATIISSIIAIVLAIYDFKYYALVAQQIIEAILIFFLVKFYTQTFIVKYNFSFDILKEHLDFGVKLTLSSFLDSLSNNFVINQITRNNGITIVGKYTQVSRINELFLGVIMMTVDKAALPTFVQYSHDLNQLKVISIKLLTLLSLFSYLMLAILITSSDSIVRIVLGVNWVESSWILQLIAFCGFSQIIEIVLRNFLKSQGKSNIILFYGFLKILLLVIVLCICGFLLQSLKFILLGLVLASLINVVIYLLLISKALKIKVIQFFLSIIKPLCSALLTIFIVHIVENSLFIPSNFSFLSAVIRLFLNSLLVMGLYSLFLMLLGYRELKIFKNLLNSILFLLKRRKF